MKFGNTLALRSVPQWQNYNLDYAAIKQLIKEHTTPGKGKAVAIPGRSSDVNAAFEQQLFQIFAKEHDRLGLFVKSKTYEINSRLGSIDRQLSFLRQKKQLGAAPQHHSLRTRQRLLRIESEILKLGEEIQNLSRFISINRQGIRKLVKKYQKWSKSTTFGPMIEHKLLARPDSFAEVKMKPSLLQYTAYLGAVRSPFENQQEPPPQPQLLPDSPVATDDANDDALERQFSFTSVDSVGKAEHGPSGSVGTGVEFDTALDYGSTPLQTKEAIYWVHQDNLVELRILLLQYLRYAKILTSSRPASSSASGTLNKKHLEIKKEDTIGEFIFEVGPSSAIPTTHKTNKPVVVTKWAGNGDAILCVDEYGCEPASPSTASKKRRAKCRLSGLDAIFSSKDVLSSQLDVDDESTQQETEAEPDFCSLESLQAHMRELPPIQCVAQITGRRSRFVGLENSNLGGRIWAALDEEVTMSPVNDDDLKNLKPAHEDNVLGISSKRRSVEFPHAILTVRAECGVDGLPTLMSVLDQSHMTERVYGYSPDAHAMILFSEKSSRFERPEWFSQLDKDIRYIPMRSQTHKGSNPSSGSGSYRSSPGNLRYSFGSANGASTSTPITDNSAETAFPAFNQTAGTSERLKGQPSNVKNGKRPCTSHDNGYNIKDNINDDDDNGRRPRSSQYPSKKNVTNESNQVRYWNEYDYPPSSVGRAVAEEEEGIFMERQQMYSQDASAGSSNRLVKWFKNLLSLGRRRTSTSEEDSSSSISSSDDENDVEVRDKTPLLSKMSTSTDNRNVEGTVSSSYETFPDLKRYNKKAGLWHHHQPGRRHRIVSMMVSMWFLALGAGVFLESACFIAVSNTGFTRIDDESNQDGVYMALVIMGIITGLLLIFSSIFGLLRTWTTMRARERVMVEEKRRRARNRRMAAVSHFSQSSSSSADDMV